MKKMKKSRVSWPPDPLLCQVKLFVSEDRPAQVASKPQCLKQSPRKPQAPDLPPGFEGNRYARPQLKLSDIPRIKWRCPSRFILSNEWLIGGGEESRERQTENSRIAKVLEAIYPHPSAIPSRPSVSPAVEGEASDDSTIPTIRLTPIEDDEREGSSPTSLASDMAVKGQRHLGPTTQEAAPAIVSGAGPDVNLAASAVLTALMKSKEQQSMIDPHLLVKFLSNPKIVQTLVSHKTPKPPDTMTPPSTDISPRPPLQPVPNSAVARTTQPLPCLNQTFATPQPFTCSEPTTSRMLPPMSGNRAPFFASASVQPCNTVAMEPPQHVPSSAPLNLNPQQPPPGLGAFPVPNRAQPPQRPHHALSTMPMNPNPVERFAELNPVVKSQSEPQPLYGGAFSMNGVQSSQLGFSTYPREMAGGAPMKSVDYFKNLIREHGTDNPGASHERKQYQSQRGSGVGNGNGNRRGENRKGEGKIQKACMYYGSGRGCRMGDKCMYLHDPSILWRTDVTGHRESHRPKRTKFGT